MQVLGPEEACTTTARTKGYDWDTDSHMQCLINVTSRKGLYGLKKKNGEKWLIKHKLVFLIL